MVSENASGASERWKSAEMSNDGWWAWEEGVVQTPQLAVQPWPWPAALPAARPAGGAARRT